MTVERIKEYSLDMVLPLYEAVGWTNYTERPNMLRAAWKHSLSFWGAFDDDELVGLIRCVGDGASIVYIQDLIVKPEYQRRGIGTLLVETVAEHYRDCYQMVLMTDNAPSTISFYTSLGFRKTEEMGLRSFIRIVTDEPDAG